MSHLDVDLIVLLGVMVIFMLRFVSGGIVSIKSNIWIPREIVLTEIPETDLSEFARDNFRNTDSRISGLGFHPLKSYTSNLMNRTESRIYVGPDRTTVFTVHIVTVNVTHAKVCQFSTNLDDGTEITTSNSKAGPNPVPERIKEYRMPGIENLNSLYEAHKENVAKENEKGLRIKIVDEAGILEEFRKNEQEFLEFTAGLGLFELVESEGKYYATEKRATRGIIAYLLPFYHSEYSVGGYLSRVLAVALVPPAWIYAVDGLGIREYLPTEIISDFPDGKSLFLVYLPGFVMAGILSGVLLPKVSWIICSLVALPSLYLLPDLNGRSSSLVIMGALFAFMTQSFVQKKHYPQTAKKLIFNSILAIFLYGFLVYLRL